MSTGGKGHEHAFDPASGWCAHCNLRSDGRLIGPGGVVFQAGRGYSASELYEIRQRLDQGVSA